MFISRGRTIKIVGAWKETLADVLRDLLNRRFSGRIQFYTSDYDIFIVIKNGYVVASLTVNKVNGRRIYGDEALKIIEEFLKKNDGVIEVIELDNTAIDLDLDSLPESIVSREKSDELKGIIYQEEVVLTGYVPISKAPVKETYNACDPIYLSSILLRCRLIRSLATYLDVSQLIDELEKLTTNYDIIYCVCNIVGNNRIIRLVYKDKNNYSVGLYDEKGCVQIDLTHLINLNVQKGLKCKLYGEKKV